MSDFDANVKKNGSNAFLWGLGDAKIQIFLKIQNIND
jgi:hypothetical protein